MQKIYLKKINDNEDDEEAIRKRKELRTTTKMRNGKRKDNQNKSKQKKSKQKKIKTKQEKINQPKRES